MSNTEFPENEIQQLVQDVCNQVIKQTIYSAATANSITESLIEEIVKKLADRKKDIKYLVSAVVSQRLGAGCHSAITAVWDNSQDNYVVVKWENPSFYVVVTVFGIIIDK
ncbi:Tctex-1_family protein [Hexamita inflata]|uniref:Tctex-1 family protein n=1 Tax=Hexamita inflata TaxID=28002 RepID=A0AA86NS35_9EUKA|nr:Tctex-1 family protein [Hexamita inflata]CAI9924953.1 Tctex-1 family protein [Hexamita inflata]CAI9945352.1 Tctex-1 family protein [Hexamita inflata]CAI9964032.1 Tctex-1 family protein [Hexamita inflata]